MDIESNYKKTMPELDRISAHQYAEIHSSGLVLILDNIRSAFNVGSIFRTGDGFGVSHIYLCGITCPISNRELQKTALGAEISIPSSSHNDTLEVVEDLLAKNYQIIAIEQTKHSKDLSEMVFDLNQKYAFVLGNEVEGVDESVINKSSLTIEIPQVGSKHSLNVANATSIILWEHFKQMNYGH